MNSEISNTDSVWTKTPFIILMATIACMLWGSAFPSIKIGYQLFKIPGDNSAAQILFAGIRFTLSGVMVIIAGSFIYKRPLFRKFVQFLLLLYFAFSKPSVSISFSILDWQEPAE